MPSLACVSPALSLSFSLFLSAFGLLFFFFWQHSPVPLRTNSPYFPLHYRLVLCHDTTFQDAKPKGVISLRCAYLGSTMRRKYCFAIHTALQRTYFIQAKSAEVRHLTFRALLLFTCMPFFKRKMKMHIRDNKQRTHVYVCAFCFRVEVLMDILQEMSTWVLAISNCLTLPHDEEVPVHKSA
jgi:hypothetical protein